VAANEVAAVFGVTWRVDIGLEAMIAQLLIEVCRTPCGNIEHRTPLGDPSKSTGPNCQHVHACLVLS
jgi:hypothetical protein